MNKAYEIAVDEASKGLEEGGIPIGSALERDGQVIGSGHNLRVQAGDPTAHAEISCLRNAGRQSTYRDTVLYTTLAPCFLCTGAILLFGIPRVVVGERLNFDGEGSLDLLRARGVETEILDDVEMQNLMGKFIEQNPALWHEDVGH
jgi:cytosine/creatinine deaminase